MPTVSLRPPTFSSAEAPADFTLPSIEWLSETWHVTHSSLPMWKSKRNVRIQYTPLQPSKPSIPEDRTDRLDDLVSYQSLSRDKVSRVKGVDKVSGSGQSRGQWNRRSRGRLKIASSHWKVLAWGEETGSGRDRDNKWAVTTFAETLSTPAGIDVYSQRREDLLPETLQAIKAALANVDDSELQRMASDLFEIKVDEYRQD